VRIRKHRELNRFKVRVSATPARGTASAAIRLRFIVLKPTYFPEKIIMKAKWALVFLAASAFGAVCQSASAQVAGTQTIGVSVEESQLIVEGWSATKSLLGKSIYNDSGEKVGVLHDIIIAPDNAASFAIVAAHQFLGVSQHDVAIPMSQLDFVNGKLVWAGATRDAVKSIPAFQYTKVRTVPVARQDYGKH
jgi:sporulation protein YlmC with PRC-barrel domain